MSRHVQEMPKHSVAPKAIPELSENQNVNDFETPGLAKNIDSDLQENSGDIDLQTDRWRELFPLPALSRRGSNSTCSRGSTLSGVA